MYTCLSYLKIISEKKLNTYYKNGSKLSGHVSHHGVRGSKFQPDPEGTSIGYGLAYGNKLNKNKKTFVLMSDGELRIGMGGCIVASHLI